MARSFTSTVYQYDELSAQAQARARDWFRELRDTTDLEHVIEDADRMLAVLGFAVDRRPVKLRGGATRQDPAIYYALGYSQSDGAWIEAHYSYAAGACKAIRAEAPQDATLHAIADQLRDLQRPYFYQLTARVKDDDRGPMQLDVYDARNGCALSADGPYEALREIVRDLERWIYNQLRAEDEYQSGDEQIADTIRVNEYEFTETGARA